MAQKRRNNAMGQITNSELGCDAGNDWFRICCPCGIISSTLVVTSNLEINYNKTLCAWNTAKCNTWGSYTVCSVFCLLLSSRSKGSHLLRLGQLWGLFLRSYKELSAPHKIQELVYMYNSGTNKRCCPSTSFAVWWMKYLGQSKMNLIWMLLTEEKQRMKRNT